MGIRINGNFLGHIRFADDIALITVGPDQAQTMLKLLNKESNKAGHKMNIYLRQKSCRISPRTQTEDSRFCNRKSRHLHPPCSQAEVRNRQPSEAQKWV